MVDALYAYLGQLGYTHPLHAPMTHLPLGMILGAFIFALLARLLGRSSLASTANHCTLLAFVGVFPTVGLGVMDWLHFYGGAWLFPIRMKLILAGVLTVLLLICLLLERQANVTRKTFVFFLFLAVLTSAGLGYYGGELVFSRHKLPEPESAMVEREGAEAFARMCASCHPGGGNPFKPELAPSTAPQLADYHTFLSYIRSPKARDGSSTVMPSFSEERLPDADVRAIYRYLVREFKAG